jgi:uncharacterized membrane protein YdfJ with MMPL/SSD domain
VALLTQWVRSHRKTVVGFWILICVISFAAIQPAGRALSQEFTVPGPGRIRDES